MKKYLIMLVLLVAFGTVCISATPLLAAENQAASSVIATIQLNQASAEELQALPGVGPALSERIVTYRDEHGPFKTIDQLVEVKGIGQAKLAKLRGYLKVN